MAVRAQATFESKREEGNSRAKEIWGQVGSGEHAEE